MFKKLLSLFLTMTVLFSAVSTLASCFKGGLEFRSFTYLGGSVATQYEVGDSVDLSGIQAKIRYTDASEDKTLSFSDLSFEYYDITTENGTETRSPITLETLTATAGKKVIKVKYADPLFDGEIRSTEIEINVTAPFVLAYDSLVVNTDNVQTSIRVGDSYDFSGLTATARYNDPTQNRALAYADLTLVFDANFNLTVGDHTVTVKWTDPELNVEKSTSFTVSVQPLPVLFERIEVVASSYTANYTVGDTVSFAGIVVNAIYSDATHNKAVPFADLVFTYPDGLTLATLTATAGEKDVTISYTDTERNVTKSVTVTLTVEDPLTYTGLVLNTSSVKTSYRQDDAGYDFTGLTATAVYNYTSENKALTLSDLTVSIDPATIETIGDHTVTVSWTDPDLSVTQSATFTVNVAIAGSVLFERITVSGIETNYTVGDTVDLSGIVVNAIYGDASMNKTLGLSDVSFGCPAGLTLATLTETAGEKVLTVYYTDTDLNVTKSATVTLTVNEPLTYTGLVLNTSGIKTSFTEGDSHDFSALTATARYNYSENNKNLLFTALRLVYDANFTQTPGEHTITVYWKDTALNVEKSATFTVTVAELPLVFERLTLNTDNVDKDYYVGETLSFAGIVANAIFNKTAKNKTVQITELTFTYNGSSTDNVTAAVGTYDITVSYTDTETGTTKSATFTVVVREAPKTVAAFEAPTAYTEYLNAKNTAGSAAYGDANFEAQFFKDNNAIYYVGDDNPFVFFPVLTTLVNNAPVQPASYAMDITLSMKSGNSFVALTRTQGSKASEVVFKSGDTLMATVDKTLGKYQFTSDAVGNVFTVSVLPNEAEYNLDGVTAQTIAFEVIDAYNIYTARDLMVIDNVGNTTHMWNDVPDAPNPNWVEMQEAAGLTAVAQSIKGVVFHNDIKLTLEDVPQAFFHQKALSGSYYVDKDGNEIPVPTDTYFLYDVTAIFYRRIAGGDTFRMEGNYYQMNIEEFPLIASPAVVGKDNTYLHYSTDFSNARLFEFENLTPNSTANVTINNLDFSGNANRSETKDAEGNLIYGGGLIFMKTWGERTTNSYMQADITNTLIKTSFIALFTEDYSVLNATKVKAFDSFNNGGFLIGKSTINVKDSYIQRSGGPLFIVQDTDTQDPEYATLNMTDSVCESYCNGNELWFATFGTSAMAQQLKEMTKLSEGYVNSSFVNSDGKFNFVALIMANSSEPMSVLTDFDTQGMITTTNTATGVTTTVDKTHVGVENPLSDQGAYANMIGQQVVQATGGMPTAIFNVEGVDDTLVVTQDASANYYMTFDPLTMADAATDERLPSVRAEFQQHSHMALNYGGMGMLVGATHPAQ